MKGYIERLLKTQKRLAQIIWNSEHLCGDYPKEQMGDVCVAKAEVDQEIFEKTRG